MWARLSGAALDARREAGFVFRVGCGRRLSLGRGRTALLAHVEEGAHGLGGDGAPEQPPLRLGAAKLLELVADMLGLDALRRDRDVQRVAELGDGRDDRRRLLALDQRRDEALVDLDPVDG